MLHFDRYRFQDPRILQGRMHGTELPELGFGHNFLLGCTSDPLVSFWWYTRCQVPAPGTWISRCQVHCARWHLWWARGLSLKRANKMQFRNAYFRWLVHSSRKVWIKPYLGNSVPCILPCKIGGSWNLMKERCLSKTPFLRFVYLSKFKINLPCIFWNSPKKVFIEPWRHDTR